MPNPPILQNLPDNMRADTSASFLASIPDGRDGTHATLCFMARIVRAWKRNPELRAFAISVVAHVGDKDFPGEANALFEFVRDKIRYVQDVSDLETLSTPDVTLRQQAGDCDDKCILLASMMESINHKTRFVAMGWENNPESFSHVTLETRIGAIWVNCETTEQWSLGQVPNPPPTDKLTVYN